MHRIIGLGALAVLATALVVILFIAFRPTNSGSHTPVSAPIVASETLNAAPTPFTPEPTATPMPTPTPTPTPTVPPKSGTRDVNIIREESNNSNCSWNLRGTWAFVSGVSSIPTWSPDGIQMLDPVGPYRSYTVSGPTIVTLTVNYSDGSVGTASEIVYCR